MPQLEFTSQLAQHVECPTSISVDASTLRAALETVFADHPQLREYVLDEEGAIRKHITVFVDGEMIDQRGDLDVAVSGNSEIFVMQAVAGG